MIPSERRVFVVGVGMTKFEKPGSHDKDYPDFAKEAGQKALADAGVPYSAVDQACVGYVYGDSTCGQCAIYHSLGLTGIPIINVNNNCATGSTALFVARQLIQGGLANCVLALGFEKMKSGFLPATNFEDRLNPLDKHLEVMINVHGLAAAPFAPQFFGNAAKEHMEKYGTKLEHFAKIAWKNHKHSCNNPYSQFQKEYTFDEVLQSRKIYDLLTLLQCCPTSDGAAAAVLASEELVRKNGLESRAVEITAQEMLTDLPSSFGNSCIKLVGYDMTKEAANRCFSKTGLKPEDVDVIELHDCFSPNELITYEALGLCPEGRGAELVDRGDNTYGGKWVINPSGGLLSKGHPLGATGLAQCAELCWQLRGEAGKRQVPGAKVALQHNIGLGGAVVVSLYTMGFPEVARNRQIQAIPTRAAVEGFKADLVFKEIEKKLQEISELTAQLQCLIMICSL
ncbi:sterol carrier protein 2 isoform X2 [Varanus komodoensis]|uniref:sterol carrier protein 2 isoform X2 n=1 Tax=Varanus komodoensis TaxID=61221 RepID=UPI001CF7EC12|nr:sterol carrier protein 2 isoform X2 [Varanus komodoensis]